MVILDVDKLVFLSLPYGQSYSIIVNAIRVD